MEKTATQFHIASSVTESTPLSGVKLVTSRMDGNPIVAITGSLRGGRDTAENMMVPEIMTELLSEGTKKHSKKYLEEKLESVGAAVSFECGEERIDFSGRCLSRDLPLVLSIIFEELTLPAFPNPALKKVKKRLLGQLEQAEDSTRTRAMDAFLYTAYPKSHPHHVPRVQDRMKMLAKVSRSDITKHHKKIAVRGSLIVTIAGEVDHEAVARELARQVRNWKEGEIPQKSAPAIEIKKGREVRIVMKGKPNVDATIGSPLPLRKNDQDYYALVAALGILGGREGFNGRLMQIVREKMGLTYGIYAFLSGLEESRPAYWFVWGTFGPKDLKKGLDATMHEIKRLVKDGVTDEELKIRKNIVRGSYAIALSATTSRAAALLQNFEDDRPASYLDEYPSIIGALTREEVNAAIKKYLKPSALLTVSAGGKAK